MNQARSLVQRIKKAPKTPETSADEITVDIAESDNVNNDSSSGFARRLSNKIASSVVRSGLGL